MPLVAGTPWPKQYTSITPGNGIVSVDEWDIFHIHIFTEEFSKVGASGVIWGLTSGNSIGLPPIMKFGNEYHKNLVVGSVLSGDKVICLAITEPSAGSDVANLKTTAKKTEDGKHYIVNGEKKWITNGVFADFFTTAVRTGDANGAGGVSLLLSRLIV